MVEQIFLSSQVKQSVAVSKKQLYTSCERLKTLDLRNLGNTNMKISKLAKNS